MKLSEENKEWLNCACIDTYESETERFVYERSMTEKKLLADQKRIDELETEKYQSIEAWNSKLEKLTAENAELKAELLFLTPKQLLAQHDKEVSVKAIEEMINKLAPKGGASRPDDPPHDLTIVWEVFSEIKRYAEQLQEQE